MHLISSNKTSRSQIKGLEHHESKLVNWIQVYADIMHTNGCKSVKTKIKIMHSKASINIITFSIFYEIYTTLTKPKRFDSLPVVLRTNLMFTLSKSNETDFF